MNSAIAQILTSATPAELAGARAWIADCEWSDNICVQMLTSAQVVAGINRHFLGGWDSFLAAR